MRRLSLIIALLAGLGLAAGTGAAERLYPSFDDQQLELILEQEGYTSIRIIEKGLLRFDADGTTYALYRYGDGDLQLYLGLTGVYVSYLDVNEWNATRRLSRSYLDDDGDPVLEADLLANGKLSVGNVKEFVRVFLISAKHFEDFFIERHGG